MSQYEELVKALRCCIPYPPEKCVGCTYNIGNNECAVRRMMTDAADAIEALQAEVEELKAKKMKLAENSLRFVGEVRELDKRRFEPKRGEMYFLEYDNPETGEYEQTYFQCSVCGKYFYGVDECEAKHFNYCPNCGAKMEVQE